MVRRDEGFMQGPDMGFMSINGPDTYGPDTLPSTGVHQHKYRHVGGLNPA